MSAVKATRPWGIVMARLWSKPTLPTQGTFAGGGLRAWQNLGQKGLLVDSNCLSTADAHRPGAPPWSTSDASPSALLGEFFCYATRSGEQQQQ